MSSRSDAPEHLESQFLPAQQAWLDGLRRQIDELEEDMARLTEIFTQELRLRQAAEEAANRPMLTSEQAVTLGMAALSQS